MKKFLSLVLVLMMLVPCVALAEGEMASYTHPTYGYSINYPADWTPVDKDTVNSVIESIKNGEVEGMDISIIQTYAAQIESTDMSLFASSTGDNYSVAVQALGVDMDSEMLISMVIPQILTQYEAMFTGAVMEDKGSLVVFGDKNYAAIAISYEINELPLRLRQYMIVDNGTLYMVTFTHNMGEDADAESMDASCATIMESLILPVAE